MKCLAKVDRKRVEKSINLILISLVCLSMTGTDPLSSSNALLAFGKMALALMSVLILLTESHQLLFKTFDSPDGIYDEALVDFGSLVRVIVSVIYISILLGFDLKPEGLVYSSLSMLGVIWSIQTLFLDGGRLLMNKLN
ncbi:hypothetical protein [Vibrio harveyi]|uniref:hypothetical protein n=1 Tax=Vibrio harveyi TaxID=669 RepID=UPI003CF08CB1